MARACLPVLALVIAAQACSAGGPPIAKSSPSPLTCSVSALELGPADFRPFGLARAGPLWFSAFGRVNPGAPAALESGGGPYDGWKVVIRPDPSAAGTVALTGSECGSGKVVRFCYANAGCDFATRLASSVATLYVDAGRHIDYTGYMVFPGPGMMRLIVSDLRGAEGSVVIGVP